MSPQDASARRESAWLALEAARGNVATAEAAFETSGDFAPVHAARVERDRCELVLTIAKRRETEAHAAAEAAAVDAARASLDALRPHLPTAVLAARISPEVARILDLERQVRDAIVQIAEAIGEHNARIGQADELAETVGVTLAADESRPLDLDFAERLVRVALGRRHATSIASWLTPETAPHWTQPGGDFAEAVELLEVAA